MESILDRMENRGRSAGIAIGEERGMKLGEERGKKEIAVEMIRDGEPDEKIMKYTKLSAADIRELHEKAARES